MERFLCSDLLIDNTNFTKVLVMLNSLCAFFFGGGVEAQNVVISIRMNNKSYSAIFFFVV